jgi:hypothetical protein
LGLWRDRRRHLADREPAARPETPGARRWIPSLSAYLKAVPQTDHEKQAAVDLALKGVVICLLGLMVPPLLLVGLFPLFYGVRKIIYASMGLGLLDDARR